MDRERFIEEAKLLLKQSSLGPFMEIEVQEDKSHDCGPITRFVVRLPTIVSWGVIDSQMEDGKSQPKKVVHMIDRFVEHIFKEDFLLRTKHSAKKVEGGLNVL